MQNGTVQTKEQGSYGTWLKLKLKKRSRNIHAGINTIGNTIGKNENARWLTEWNDTQTPYPRNSISQVFEEQVKRTPASKALVSKDAFLTYRQLNEKANQWARLLQQTGVQPGDPVGVCMDRSFDFVITLLAILKAGGAYIPLDPLYPKERLSFIADDTRLKIIISDSITEADIPGRNILFIYPHKKQYVINKMAKTNLSALSTPDSDAYIMYTSGSTGNPKGVCCIHKGIVRLVKNTNYIRFHSRQVFLLHTHTAFDVSTFELWGSLLNGATLVIHPEKIPSLEGLADSIRNYKITTAWFTSGLFHMMVDKKVGAFAGLKEVIAGGDVVSITHARKFLAHHQDCTLINGYGPTENTTFSTYYIINDLSQFATSVPIGKPISNTRVYILDNDLQPVMPGIQGEIYVGGDGLAKCYINRKELTEEKFITVSFSPGHIERLYRTGDMGRYLEDGNIEFLGRKDNQVKIRGFRIETGEIRSALCQHQQVNDCAIVVQEDKRLQKYLVAFVTAKVAREELQTRDLYYFLKSVLPDFMIPSSFVIVEFLPLNDSGKVDIKKLSKIRVAKEKPTHNFLLPQTITEKILTRIWKDLLLDGAVEINDNFFELGGRSLTAIQLFNEIEEQLDVRLPVSVIFQHPTISELAKLIDDQRQETWRSLQPIQRGKGKPVFYAIPGGFLYQHVIRFLGEDQPVCCFEPAGEGSIEEMAKLYLKELLAYQPEGPYFLGGYCEHGLVAYEMAQMLRAQGHTVGLLVLFETYAPSIFIPRSSIRFYTKKLRIYIREIMLSSMKEKMDFLRENIKKGLSLFQKDPDPTRHYMPDQYYGNVMLFKAERSDIVAVERPYMGWEEHVTGQLEVFSIPGTHMGMLYDEVLAQMVSGKLKDRLEKAYKK